MNTTQKAEFEQRRLCVLRKHIEHDPKLRAMRRKRKLSMMFSVAGSFGAIAVALLLIKSFLLALHGPQGYAQIVAPVVEQQGRGSVVVQLIDPDPVSAGIAAALRPALPSRERETVAMSGLPAPDPAMASDDADSVPEL